MTLYEILQFAFVFCFLWIVGEWKWPGNLIAGLLRPFGFERVTDLERLWLENRRKSKE